MQLSEIANSAGLIQDVYFWTGVDSSSYPVVDVVRRLNEWYRTVDILAWQSDQVWEFDDRNFSTMPIATANLVDNQDDYSLPSTARDVQQVEVKDKNGNWILLKPIDKAIIRKGGTAYEEFRDTKGIPRYYDMVGNSIRLHPAPDGSRVTTTSGLQIYVGRDIKPLTISSTQTEPGFHPNFHQFLSLGAAQDFLIKEDANPDKLNRINAKLNDMAEAIREYFASRMRELPARIDPKVESSV